jgi:hypothetical protein
MGTNLSGMMDLIRDQYFTSTIWIPETFDLFTMNPTNSEREIHNEPLHEVLL